MLVKLRNRFFLLMMSFSIIVLSTAFIAIYTISYFKTTSEINEKLSFNEILEVNSNGEVTFGTEKATAIVVNRVFPNLGIYFNLIVNEDGKILVIDSALELPFSVYEKAGQDAWINNNKQLIKFEDRIWRYKITPIETKIVLDDERTFLDHSDKNYQIRFLDVTESVEGLITLRNTLIQIGVILLFIFFFMSIYFSNLAIKPMRIVWENQQRFLEDASHELKTPLSVITANIGVLYANKEESVNSQLKWLEYIVNGTKRMSGLIQSMLMLSKIETDNTFLVKSSINISKVLVEIIDSFEAVTNDKNISIKRYINKDILVNSSIFLIDRIIHILVDNAVRYTPIDGVIEITLYKEKSMCILNIQNSGSGISKEDLPNIFNRFFRSDISRSNNGDSYGLGLSIAKSGVEKIGGTIEVKSIKDQKTTFIVKIPL